MKASGELAAWPPQPESPERKNGWISHRKFIRFALLAGIVIAAILASRSVSYGAYATYSDRSVGSNGTIYGWGVTDVTTYGYIHTAKVSTTLTSPAGRTVSSGTKSATNSVRADVSLFFNYEEGNFTVSSVHDGYCQYMGHFLNGVRTSCLGEIGHSLVWYRWDHYDPDESQPDVYYPIVPCNTACNSREFRSWRQPPKTYLNTWYFWWRRCVGCTKYCLLEIERFQNYGPGTCGESPS